MFMVSTPKSLIIFNSKHLKKHKYLHFSKWARIINGTIFIIKLNYLLSNPQPVLHNVLKSCLDLS